MKPFQYPHNKGEEIGLINNPFLHYFFKYFRNCGENAYTPVGFNKKRVVFFKNRCGSLEKSLFVQFLWHIYLIMRDIFLALY